jgi:hypothetical protein
MTFSVLSQYVDVEPGTTLGRVLDMVDSDQELKRFLGEYCGCDIEGTHKRSREGGEPIQVLTAFEKEEDGLYRATEIAVADVVVVTLYFYIFTDDVTGERRLEGKYILMAQWVRSLPRAQVGCFRGSDRRSCP